MTGTNAYTFAVPLGTIPSLWQYNWNYGQQRSPEASQNILQQYYWPRWPCVAAQPTGLISHYQQLQQYQPHLNTAATCPSFYDRSAQEANVEQVPGRAQPGINLAAGDDGPPWTDLENSLLGSMVAFFANLVPAKADGKIKLSTLPWEHIAAYIFPVPLAFDERKEGPIPLVGVSRRSGEACYKQWKSLFPRHFLMRVATGVMLCKKQANQDEFQLNIGVQPREAEQDELEKQLSRRSSTNSQTAESIIGQKRPRKHWSEEEKESIDALQQVFGNKWTLIASKLKTKRTATEVKNYWHHNKHKILSNRTANENKTQQSGSQ